MRRRHMVTSDAPVDVEELRMAELIRVAVAEGILVIPLIARPGEVRYYVAVSTTGWGCGGSLS